eukprot:scaffold94532_cov75-Phaeocystis_antarctica.AAC.3
MYKLYTHLTRRPVESPVPRVAVVAGARGGSHADRDAVIADRGGFKLEIWRGHLNWRCRTAVWLLGVCRFVTAHFYHLTQHSITAHSIPGPANSSGRLLQVDVAAEAAISASTAGGGGHSQRHAPSPWANRAWGKCGVAARVCGRVRRAGGRTIASSARRACLRCR